MRVVFLVAFACVLAVSSSDSDTCKGGIFHNATFGMIYNCTVNSMDDIRFIFQYNFTAMTTAVRILTQSSNASLVFPVMFVIKQQLSILSWKIPTLLTTPENLDYSYLNISRTLCPEQSKETMVKQIVVDVSTMNSYETRFELVAELEDLTITTMWKQFSVAQMDYDNGSCEEESGYRDTIKNVSVSPAKSRFYRYDFPSDVSSVIVKVHSDDDLCAVLSVQDAECPVFDMYGSVEHVGYRQTITRRGAMTMQRTMFASPSFFIVLVVKPNDLECEKFQHIFPSSADGGGNDDNLNRNKRLSISIERTMSDGQLYAVVFVTLAIFLSFYLMAVIVSVICHFKYKRDDASAAAPLNESEIRNLLVDHDDAPTQNYGSMATTSGSQPEHDDLSVDIHSRHHSAMPSTSSIAPSSVVKITRTKTCLCVADLAKIPGEILAKKYNLYVWNLITLAIFYVLPVIQLVITYQMVVYKTGDEDICYYNFYCAHQVGFLSAFNNVYSNIGYFLLGFLFILLVYRRQVLHERMCQARDKNKPECGIPQHFGVFYAMGIALSMEGILSGCYHVCPSFNNFQFDTAFMYMIGWLCMLKIYQTRHPDVNAHAHTAYCAIAFLVFFGVIGVTQGSLAFWVVFVIIYILCSIYLSINIYYMGQRRLYSGIICGTYRTLRRDGLRCSWPRYVSRWCLLVIGNTVNIGFAIFGAITMPKDVASYLLAIVIINLLMYFIFYIFMKKLCGEKILWPAALFIALATVGWSAGLFFFMRRLTSWQMTPAKSRESNEECLLAEFYDSHDIWHFLSALSLFLSFMVLLVLEDDLIEVPRENIAVF